MLEEIEQITKGKYQVCLFRCKVCGYEKEARRDNVKRYSFRCSECSRRQQEEARLEKLKASEINKRYEFKNAENFFEKGVKGVNFDKAIKQSIEAKTKPKTKTNTKENEQRKKSKYCTTIQEVKNLVREVVLLRVNQEKTYEEIKNITEFSPTYIRRCLNELNLPNIETFRLEDARTNKLIMSACSIGYSAREIASFLGSENYWKKVQNRVFWLNWLNKK